MAEEKKPEEVKYERKCRNWLKDFGRWTLPRSEAPETFIFWTGLFTLASAVRRHVTVPKKYMGSYEISPNLYVLFIAGAGKARKSTTGNYTTELLNDLGITEAPELITKESLLSGIVRSPDASMSIYSPEFGEFIVKSGPDMYGFLTNIYDGKKRISASTLSRGVELAERPCVNLLGATTPEWVAANMPESVIGGGFASRVIFIREKGVRRRQLYYESIDQDALEQLRLNLLEDLKHIAAIEGEFEIHEDAKTFMEGWYRETADRHTEAEYKMHGYFERKPVHVHKVAMLLHLSRSDTLVLEERDFQEAIQLLNMVEKNLPDVFSGIGKNEYVVDMKRIYAYIEEKGRTTRKELLNQFEHVAQPYLLNQLIDGAIEMGAIKWETFENEGTFLTIAHQNGNRARKQQHDLPTSPLELLETHEQDH